MGPTNSTNPSEWERRLSTATRQAARIGEARDESGMVETAQRMGWWLELEAPYADGTGMLFARDVCGCRVQASFATLHGGTVWLQFQLCTGSGYVTYLPGGRKGQGLAQAFGVTYSPAIDGFIPPEVLSDHERAACIGMARVFRDANAGTLKLHAVADAADGVSPSSAA